MLTKSGPSPRSVKAFQMEPGRLSGKGFVTAVIQYCQKAQCRRRWHCAMFTQVSVGQRCFLYEKHRTWLSLFCFVCCFVCLWCYHQGIWRGVYSVSPKKIPPTVFWNFFPNGWEFLINFLHTYYTIISTLECKFLFKYLQLWQSYAILSATT